MSPDELMRHAIAAAERGVDQNQSPFGCAIARDGDLIVACHNVVWQTTDITAHAEVTAIREACRKLEQILLTDCVVATTCEPCPMCTAALHWARVSTVYYGATIADAAAAGFNELKVDAEHLLREGSSSVALHAGTLAEECRTLFSRWSERGSEAY